MPVSQVISLCRKLARRLKRVIPDEEVRTAPPTWCIAVSSNGEIGNPVSPQVLRPPEGLLYADPFVVSFHGDYYVFFEVSPSDRLQGYIACKRVADLADGKPPVVVLEQPYHLSFPFLIEREGELFMIPETARNSTVELYRCTDFPSSWEKETDLLRGLSALDTIIFENDAGLWMFTNVVAEGRPAATDLNIYFADDLKGPWRPHPGNPVVSDIRCGRPAGNIFMKNGDLIRPGQDCSKRYGERIILRKIVTLSRTHYEEMDYGVIEAGDIVEGSICVHTVNVAGDYAFYDVMMNAPR